MTPPYPREPNLMKIPWLLILKLRQLLYPKLLLSLQTYLKREGAPNPWNLEPYTLPIILLSMFSCFSSWSKTVARAALKRITEVWFETHPCKRWRTRIYTYVYPVYALSLWCYMVFTQFKILSWGFHQISWWVWKFILDWASSFNDSSSLLLNANYTHH